MVIYCVFKPNRWLKKQESLLTLAAEQKIAHVVAEGAADVATAVRQGARQAAVVEWSERVGTGEAKTV